VNVNWNNSEASFRPAVPDDAEELLKV